MKMKSQMTKSLVALFATGLLLTSCDEIFDDVFDDNDDDCVPAFCWDFVYPMDVLFKGDSTSVASEGDLIGLYEMCCEDDDWDDDDNDKDSTGYNDTDTSDCGGCGDYDYDDDDCVELLFPLEVYNVDGVADTVVVADENEYEVLEENCDED